MITKEEMQQILHTLGLDYEAEANQVYVFIQHADGRIDNFSINIKRAHAMSDSSIADFMRREYPATRHAQVLATERPTYRPPTAQWIDSTEVCQMLKISRSTLKRWRNRGLFTPSVIGGRSYYRRADIEQCLENNLVQENGRIDPTALEGAHTCS